MYHNQVSSSTGTRCLRHAHLREGGLGLPPQQSPLQPHHRLQWCGAVGCRSWWARACATSLLRASGRSCSWWARSGRRSTGPRTPGRQAWMAATAPGPAAAVARSGLVAQLHVGERHSPVTPLPWLRRASVLKSIEQLGCSYLDLCLIHWPEAWLPGSDINGQVMPDTEVTLQQTWWASLTRACAARALGGVLWCNQGCSRACATAVRVPRHATIKHCLPRRSSCLRRAAGRPWSSWWTKGWSGAWALPMPAWHRCAAGWHLHWAWLPIRASPAPSQFQLQAAPP